MNQKQILKNLRIFLIIVAGAGVGGIIKGGGEPLVMIIVGFITFISAGGALFLDYYLRRL